MDEALAISDRRRRRQRRRRRRVLILAGLGAAAAFGGGWLMGPGRGRVRQSLLAANFIYKIRRGESSPSDYALLGKTGVWFAEGVLREGVYGADPEVSEKALGALYLSYPHSEEAVACREYEEIRAGEGGADHGYFWRFSRRSVLPPRPLDADAAAARWGVFLERHPFFPGADDAALRWGWSLVADHRYPEAAVAFARGRGLGDRSWRIAGSLRAWFYRVLDHGCSSAELESLVDESALRNVRGLVAYTRGVVLAREGRWKEAAVALAAVEDELVSMSFVCDRATMTCNGDYAEAGPCEAALSFLDDVRMAFEDDLAVQRRLFEDVAGHAADAAAAYEAGDVRAWARAKLKAARRLGADRHALLNLLVHECSDPVRYVPWRRAWEPNREGQKTLAEAAARRSRAELVVMDLVDEVSNADVGPRLRRRAASLRVGVVSRLTREWRSGHRSHYVLGAERDWKRRAAAARREERRVFSGPSFAALAAGLGGASSAAVAVPRPVGPVALGGLFGGAVAGRSHAVVPPVPRSAIASLSGGLGGASVAAVEASHVLVAGSVLDPLEEDGR